MRNTIRIAIVLVLLVQTALAQENISNKFYFKYAISTPTNSFAGFGEWKEDGDYKKGGAIEIGSILYFKNLDLGAKSKLGLDVSYLSVSKHVLGTENSGNDPKLIFYNIGSKIGPVYTYNIWIN
jgi:hypothetical protein